MKKFIYLPLILTLSACTSYAPVQNAKPDYLSWSGKWTGVEGTYLNIVSSPRSFQSYNIEIRDLDGSKFYDGTASEHGITFTRNGKVETLHKGNGVETGMKWLTEKQNCLIVRTGEGYCRD